MAAGVEPRMETYFTETERDNLSSISTACADNDQLTQVSVHPRLIRCLFDLRARDFGALLSNGRRTW